jgi:hypothetical protein
MARRRRATIRRPTSEGPPELQKILDFVARGQRAQAAVDRMTAGGCECGCVRCDQGYHCGELENLCKHFEKGDR